MSLKKTGMLPPQLGSMCTDASNTWTDLTSNDGQSFASDTLWQQRGTDLPFPRKMLGITSMATKQTKVEADAFKKLLPFCPAPVARLLRLINRLDIDPAKVKS